MINVTRNNKKWNLNDNINENVKPYIVTFDNIWIVYYSFSDSQFSYSLMVENFDTSKENNSSVKNISGKNKKSRVGFLVKNVHKLEWLCIHPHFYPIHAY